MNKKKCIDCFYFKTRCVGKKDNPWLSDMFESAGNVIRQIRRRGKAYIYYCRKGMTERSVYVDVDEKYWPHHHLKAYPYLPKRAIRELKKCEFFGSGNGKGDLAKAPKESDLCALNADYKSLVNCLLYK